MADEKTSRNVANIAGEQFDIEFLRVLDRVVKQITENKAEAEYSGEGYAVHISITAERDSLVYRGDPLIFLNFFENFDRQIP